MMYVQIARSAASLRFIRRLVGSLAAAALLAGCGNEADPATDLPPTRQQWIAELIAEGGSDAERPYLEDGVVTAAEREAAYLAYLNCLEDNGVEVLWYELTPDGDGLRGERGGLSESEHERISTDCRREYYNVVGIVFVEQNAPTAEQEAGWWREAGECMRELGHDVPASPTMDDLFEIDPYVANECYEEVASLR